MLNAQSRINGNRPIIIKGMDQQQLSLWCESVGEPAYRGKQIFNWLYHQGISDPQQMSNLPASLTAHLAETILSTGKIVERSATPDGSTIKYLIELIDGRTVEAVSMLIHKRHTVCVSSQVGCNLDCNFCATASMGFVRNLSAGEIFDQILLAQSDRGKPVTNVVFMGMGEPFLNYSQVIAAAELMHDQAATNIAAHRITISTAGVVPQIETFTREGRKFTLAISLNSPSDAIRKQIMPLNQQWPLDELLTAARQYTKQSKRKITFEYVLLAGINDDPAQADDLLKILKGLMCKVNIIPYNELGSIYKRPADATIDAFFRALSGASFPVTIRWSNGTDIGAGCGQLATGQDT
jgi:23S rRNA (adenine2503-C2)-methyltransferase